MLKPSLKAYLQYCLPQHLLSNTAGRLANARCPRFKNWLIQRFIQRYQIDLSEAERTQAQDYDSFNDFFTRRLKASARPIASGHQQIISPVDGNIAQIGRIEHDQLIQAKGMNYSLSALLTKDEVANDFRDGAFATLYLAPHNYHRVHMPMNGTLIQTIYVPGKLFSVNLNTSQHIPNLFARNERLIALFDTEAGRMAVIFVGALIVGNIQPAWRDSPPRQHRISVESIAPPQAFNKGDELGYFSLGSTVILLFCKNHINWLPELSAGNPIQMGQMLGNLL